MLRLPKGCGISTGVAETETKDEATYYPGTIEMGQLADGQLTPCVLDDRTEVCVARSGQRVTIFRDLCPHMGGQLAQGRLCADRKSIECPWHGYIFDLDSGQMTENPNDATFAPLREKYASYKPAPHRYKLQIFQFDRDGETIRVRRTGRSRS